jgi:hypothetical protein
MFLNSSLSALRYIFLTIFQLHRLIISSFSLMNSLKSAKVWPSFTLVSKI